MTRRQAQGERLGALVTSLRAVRAGVAERTQRTQRTQRTYAEPGDVAQGASVRQAQDAVDRMVDRAVAGAPALVDPWVTAVLTLIEGASSLAEIRDALPGLYATASHRPLGEHLGVALAAAEALGRASVRARTRRSGPADRTDRTDRTYADGEVTTEGPPFTGATAMWRALGFGISGVAQADFLSAVRGHVERALTDGTALRDFQRTVQDLAASHEVYGLTPARLETIYRTNTQRAYQAARYRELSDPGVQALLPYWRYVAVMDNRVRPEHAAMHDKIYRADDPIWREWYPPNGFNCRCTVVPLTEDELRAEGLTVETEPPDTTPDPGWSGRGGDLETILARMAAEPADPVYREVRTQPGPEALGRPLERTIPETAWQRATLAPSLEQRMEETGQTRRSALAAIEAEYKATVGISPKETSGLVVGPDGEAVRVDLQGLAHAMLNRTDRRERYLPLFRRTLEDPFELLLSEYAPPGGGEPKLRKKAVGLYRIEDRTGLVVTAEATPEGWTLWNVLPARQGTIDRLRRGHVVLATRDGGAGTSQGG